MLHSVIRERQKSDHDQIFGLREQTWPVIAHVFRIALNFPPES